MKRQLFIAQLAMLLEQRAAQDRLGRQTLSPSLLDAMAPQTLGHEPEELAMLVQLLRHRLQLTADLVLGEEIEQVACTVRSWRIVGSGGGGFAFRISGLIRKLTRNRRASHPPKGRFDK